MNEKLLVSYCFMTALLNNGKDLYEAVYLPIFKYCLAAFVEEQKSKQGGNIEGTVADVVDKINEIYGISIPIVVAQPLLASVESTMSRRKKEKYSFKRLDKNTFQCNEYDFAEKRNEYENARRDANKLEIAFHEYLKQNACENIDDIPSLSDFMKEKAISVSAFLKSKILEPNVDKSYLHHANFLKQIELSDAVLYKIAKNIYIGSVISVFFEYSSEPRMNNTYRNSYYLDTQVVLEALDLQDGDRTRPARELIQLITSSNGSARILNITYLELSNVIDNAIKGAKSDNSIQKALKRRGKSRTDLMILKGNLEKELALIGINLQSISESDIYEFSQSPDIEKLGETRSIYSKNAKHDVMAYLYIRKLRAGNCMSINDIPYWFVCANKNLLEFNKAKSDGHREEIITPEVLTSMLFYQNPQYAANASGIGLNLLISQAIYEETPDVSLVEKFGEIVKEKDLVSDKEYETIMGVASELSSKALNKIISDVETKPDKASVEIKRIKDKARKKEEELSVLKDLAQDANDSAKKANDEAADVKRKYLQLSENNKNLNDDNSKLKQENKRLLMGAKIAITLFIIFVFVFLALIESVRIWFLSSWVITLVSSAFMLFVLLYPWLWNQYKRCVKIICGLSGLWGLFNLLLNLISKLKNI